MAERPFRTVLVPHGRTSVSRRLLRRAVLTVIAERKSEYKATQEKAEGPHGTNQRSPASRTCQS
jgi:hypothetical protein